MTSSKLEELAEVVAWLDSARWSKENQKSLGWQPLGLSLPSQEILLHWLAYITDIQRPWQYVWNEGRKIFVGVVKSFSIHDFQTSKDISTTYQKIVDFLDNFRGHEKEGKVRPFVYKDTKYRPRYPNQHTFIERTLTILAHQYDRDFLRFVGESIKRWRQDPVGLRRVAFDLYLLTYSNYQLDRIPKLFAMKDAQKVAYSLWNRFGYKRLWAALRDYRKATSYLTLFQKGLDEAYGPEDGERLYAIWTTAENFGLNLLELPGDIRNINFMQRLVVPLAKHSGMQIRKSWGASRVAREIYDKQGSNLFYPEQLDVSWDLSAKACENELCDLCPFGGYAIENVCLSNTSAVQKKYCPIALATCQYRIICNQANCPVVKGKGKNLCTHVS